MCWMISDVINSQITYCHGAPYMLHNFERVVVIAHEIYV